MKPEMVMTADINVRALAAVSKFASTEETRYYLNGVRVEIETRSVLYVATDGHRLMALREDKLRDTPDNDMTGSFIIPTAQARAFKCKKGDPGSAFISGDDDELMIQRGSAGVVFKPIDGTFPAWRKVIPSGPLAQGIGQFNADFLASFRKFALEMDAAEPFLAHNGGDGLALLRFDGIDAIGVIMPIRRTDGRMVPLPLWATSQARAAA